MITQSPYIINADEMDKADDLGLGIKPEQEIGYIEFGFRLSDVKYYKILLDEDVILLMFNNGREEEIKYSQSMHSKLKQVFEKV